MTHQRFEQIYGTLRAGGKVMVECETSEVERDFLRRYREFSKDRPQVSGQLMTMISQHLDEQDQESLASLFRVE
jgi:hypothetical protein